MFFASEEADVILVSECFSKIKFAAILLTHRYEKTCKSELQMLTSKIPKQVNDQYDVGRLYS